jgi:hypothetical protein
MRGVFLFRRFALLGGDTLDIDGVRAFGGIFGIEGDFVAFLKFVKGDANQGFAVEEQVFIAAIRRDKTKSPVSLFLYYSGHMLV